MPKKEEKALDWEMVPLAAFQNQPGAHSQTTTGSCALEMAHFSLLHKPTFGSQRSPKAMGLPLHCRLNIDSAPSKARPVLGAGFYLMHNMP